MDYETGNADQWHQAYRYDADNRITDAYSTETTPMMDPVNGVAASHNEMEATPYWDREVSYTYYQHGPLARTELGELNVQGQDFVYTLQGWLKGVNSNTLNDLRDPGNDAFLGAVNSLTARDAYGYSLHYFATDYDQVGMQGNVFVADQHSSVLTANSSDLYNGNIARMVTTITNPDTREVLPLGNAYKYDQLNRLMEANSFTVLDLVANDWDAGGSSIYRNAFAYDANGNITKQLRRNGANAPVDSLTYRYHESNGKRLRNRLYHVEDSVGNGAFGDDVDDMGTFTGGSGINTANNYSYDKEGRLVQDRQEKLDTILWRVDGKVAYIKMDAVSGKNNLRFDYDAMGHRIAKHVYNDEDELEHSTYYVLDAQGNVLSVYEHAVDEEEESTTFYQAEKHIYGSSRLGVLNDSIPLLGTENDTYDMTVTDHIIGKRVYELSNHLGNVLSTVSDKIIPVERENEPLVDQDFSSSYTPFSVYLISSGYLDAGRYHLDDASMWGSASFILPTEPGATYTISYDIDLDGAGNVRAYTHDPTTHLNLTDQLVTTGGSGSHSYTVTATGTTTLFTWSNEDPMSPRDFYLDNVSITRDLGEEALYFLADIRTAQDYSPFGVTLEGRNFVLSGAEKGRYGYQGSEMDNETKGHGNSYTTEFRQLDPRLGRWLTIDPFADPSSSPYNSMDNSPLSLSDPLGLYTKNRAERVQKRAEKWGATAFIANATGGKKDWIVDISYKHCGQEFHGVYGKGDLTSLDDLTMEVKRPSHLVEDMNGETPSMTEYEMDIYDSQEESLGSFRKREAVIDREEEIRRNRIASVDNLGRFIAGVFEEGVYLIAGGEVIEGAFQGCRWIYNAYKTTKTATKTTQATKIGTEAVSNLKPTHYVTKSQKQMQGLVNDIREKGITDAIEYVEHEGTKYIVDGHHRYFAAQRIGLQNVPVKQVQLPLKGYSSPADFILEGTMPRYWQYIK